ncbi:unnamed protein product [Rotaria sp. Silwood1]|nr:unnamed protein product [Rotaria sp. Silwood1]CAF0958495.1 unnamed protein product [Rotaria sp. Silwood1]CAF3401429.1 unnamed protein product [Rotaria sp. Silwood1]CAF4664889.1 unnamed protein product [Rotaria sp. Silwood1]
MNNKSKFKTLVIIDLETTGLIYDEPKITELAMVAVNITTLEEMKVDEELPRVLNKFVKLFDPVKLLRASVAELTGLNNRMLVDYAPFNRETVIAMETFLSDFQKPMCFVAHNGNLFDFPILFSEIKSALSSPSFYANITTNNNHNNNHNECILETNTTISNDNVSLACLTTKDSCIQTITTRDDYNQTSLLSIECADSLVFFRQIHRLLNDKDLVQYLNENIPLEPFSVISNQNECQNNVSVDSNELASSSSSSATATNHNSSSRLGYVEIPIKYIPSQDPTRQQQQQLSMKLIKIYEREFNQKASQLKSHRAEDDCLMLLALLKRYLPDWLEWIELNHQSLSNFSSLPFTSTKQTLPKSTENTKRPLKF